MRGNMQSRLARGVTVVFMSWTALGFQRQEVSAAPATSAPIGFFVAPQGNDHWSGTIAKSKADGQDGPFATLERALEAVRQARNRAGAEATLAEATISLGDGQYFLSAPIVLKPEDSHLAIAATVGESPTLSGGRPISGWREVTVAGKPLWSAEVPLLDGHPWAFHELWVNGRRAVRARHPQTGYLAVAGLPDKAGEWTKGHSRFQFRAGDLRASPTITNAEVVVMNRWVESRLPITQVDEQNNIVSFSKKSVFTLEKGDLYYVEGAMEFLDTPGEWYLDRERHTLFYLPRAGEVPEKTMVVAPVLAQVVRLEGRRDQPVEGVRFVGVTLSHTEWCFPDGFSEAKHRPTIDPAPAPDVGGFGQAAIGVPGAVWGEYACGCAFSRCVFVGLGDYGLELGRGCRTNRVEGCEFAQLGAGGIKLGETAIRTDAADQAADNQVSNCHIHDGGLMFHSAIGVWIGQSPGNRIEHNHIHDFYYTGISIGWTWGYGPALASSNLVAFNHIHHIGVKSNGDGPILSDMGGIYTLGKQPGTVIRNNLWHDFAGIRYGGWGIYFDEGSSGILAENNVVFRTTHGGFHQHYGETNLVRNNVFAFARDHQLQRSRPENHTSFIFATNIVYFDAGVLVGGDLSNDHYVIDHNLYFDARPGAKTEALPIGPCTLAQWRERGHDRESLIADPLFTNPKAGDFGLKAGSPAWKLGFQPIDLQRVGIVASNLRDAGRRTP